MCNSLFHNSPTKTGNYDNRISKRQNLKFIKSPDDIWKKNASRHTKKKIIFCAPQLEFTANKLASLEKVRCSVPPLYYYVKLNNILNVYILRILCAGLKSCFYKTFGTCKFFFYYFSKHLRKVLSGMFFLMLLAGLDWRLSFNDYNRSCSENFFFVSLWHPRFIFPFPHSGFWKRLYLYVCTCDIELQKKKLIEPKGIVSLLARCRGFK